MARFRRRIGTVEAVQFDPCGVHKETLPSGVTFTFSGCILGEGVYSRHFIGSYDDPTWICAGDWLATQPDGRLRCYTDEDFRHMFEPAEGEDE